MSKSLVCRVIRLTNRSSLVIRGLPKKNCRPDIYFLLIILTLTRSVDFIPYVFKCANPERMSEFFGLFRTECFMILPRFVWRIS